MPKAKVRFGCYRSVGNRSVTRLVIPAALSRLVIALAFISAVSTPLSAQTAVDRPPDQIGPNSKVWITTSSNSVTEDTQLTAVATKNLVAALDQDAAPAPDKPVISRVEEIMTGMNYWDGEKWTPSEASFDLASDGFVATRLQYILNISSNINTTNAINILTRDGVTIRSTPVAIGLYDAASGASLIIGAITNSTGVLVSSNRLVFENAFCGISADLVYSIEKGSFEQDAVIRNRLDPADYGFPRETSRIQVFTEVYEAPAPEKIRRPLYVEENEAVRNKMASPDVVDEVLGFGEFVMATGRAFDSQSDNSPTNAAASVAKELRTAQDGRTFLIESVDFSQIKDHLDALPIAAPAPDKKEATLRRAIKPAKARVGYAAIPSPSGKRIKQTAAVKSEKPAVLVAKNSSRRRGVTIDFIATVGGTLSSSMVFRGDGTYFVSGAVICNGAVTIEGGAVFKFKHYTTTPTGYASIKLNNTLTCKTTSYRPAIFTAVDDDVVGTTMNGYPGSGYQNPPAIRTDGYANPALWVYNVNQQLSNLRFSYCQEAIRFEGNNIASTISHAQLVNCIRGIVITGCGCGSALPIVNNALFAKVTSPITLSRNMCYPKFYHCTVDTPSGSTLVTASSSSICYFYNSIVANLALLSSGPVTLTGDCNGFYNVNNNQQFGTNPKLSASSPFQTGGAGNYYLASGGAFRNAGTKSGISASLLTDLARRTVDPPILLSPGSYPSGYIFLPQVTLDNGPNPHLGAHYDQLDFLISQLSFAGNGSVALLTNGVAVGIYGPSGFSMAEQGAVISQGGPLAMNRLVFYPSVQEQPLFNGVASLTPASAIFDVSTATSTLLNAIKPIINLRFTDIPMLGLRQKFFSGTAAPLNLNTVSAKDCWLRGVDLTVSGATSAFYQTAIPAVTLWNNLMERTTVSLFTGPTGASENPLSLGFYNNLFWQSDLPLTYRASSVYHPSWTIQDNLFDTTNTISLFDSSNPESVIRSYNAFFNTPTSSQIAGTADVPLTALSYTNGPDSSPWYVANSSPTIFQVDTTRTAAAAGLYHYTVKLDQTKAGVPTPPSTTPPNGSIGWHHVALTSQNVALHKYVTQSSTATGGEAYRAIDGNTSGIFSSGSVTLTASANQPWWQIDLGASASIGTINVWSRTDCCALSNFYLLVSDDPFVSTSLAAVQSQTGVSSYYFPGTVTTSTSFTIGRTGRFVRVQLAATAALSLAEVQIQTTYSPSDSENDGLPDYFENTAGNGLVNAGETDWTGPIVAITTPTDGFSIGTTRINIHGTVTHTSPIKSVKVNGISGFLNVNGIDFDALNVPLSIGANRIGAVAEDMNGNTGASSMNISGVPSGANLIDPVSLTATPVAGFDSLNVSFQAAVDQNFPGTIQEVRVDFAGGNSTASGNLGPFTHVYNVGQFFPVVTVRTLVGTTSLSFSSLGGWNPTTADALRINVQQPPVQGQNIITIPDPVDLKFGGPSGHLYVLSRSGNAVNEYDSNEAPAGSIPLPSGSVPTGLDVDSDGNIYVALSARHQVAKYKLTGGVYGLDLSFNGTGLIGKSNQSSGSGNGEFNAPYDVAVTPDRTGIAVSDSGNNRIQQFSAANGTFVQSFGSQGTAVGQFNTPKGLTYDNVGYLYIVDSGNNRLALALSSEVIGTSGTSGTALGQFQGAVNLCVGSRGIYVGETGNNRVQVFGPSAGGPGSAPTPFTIRLSLSTELGLSQPNAIAPIPDFLAEKIYIADTGHGRVLKVTLPETTTPDTAWTAMNTSLSGNHLDQAISCFSRATADDYRGWFSAIGTATVSSLINGKTLWAAVIEAETAQYYFEDTIGGETITFPVEFVKENGIWKILEF